MSPLGGLSKVWKNESVDTITYVAEAICGKMFGFYVNSFSPQKVLLIDQIKAAVRWGFKSNCVFQRIFIPMLYNLIETAQDL